MSPEKDDTLNSRYWDTFYQQNRGHLPSQFCVSVLGDIGRHNGVVELGSGNGRDAHYFASQGRITAAMDISEQAIMSCLSYAAEQKIRHSTFLQGDITDPSALANLVRTARNQLGDAPITFYSRFVLHALNDAQEQAFLSNLPGVVKSGEQVFFEFRSLEDASLKKTFGGHYRRFIDTDKFVAQLTGELGFTLDYRLTGQGMAKFKDEDPWVSRVIVSRA